MAWRGKCSIDLSHPMWGACMDLVCERRRQDATYGHLNGTLGPDGWLAVLAREFCEAGNEANEMYKGRVTDPTRLRAELVQLAAVAVAWVEALDAQAAIYAQVCDRASANTTPNPPRVCPACQANCLGFDCPNRQL